ncbi:MAG: HutD family protein [Massilia sp.]
MSILIPFAQLAPSPWKNGGGSTTEIAIEPAGATLHNFDWRLSLAAISHGGPFSHFPGIDRSLALLDGPGLTLDIGSNRQVLLEGEDSAISFPGEADVIATLHDAPTLDLNVMTRREVCQHKLGRRRIDGSARFAPGGQKSILFLAAGESLTVSSEDERIGLVRFDAVVFEPGKLWLLEGDDATVFIIDIYQRPASP